MHHALRVGTHPTPPPRPRSRGGATRGGRRTTAGGLVLLAAVALLLLALAPGAPAAPPGPTWDLAQLGTALEAGPLDGYLLTTMQGTTPESIPLKVQTLITYSDGTLILFEASGPVIDRLGGIAAGMSGSPVYVNSGGTDYLVGALSYGDMFTRGGTGLATPIEYMAAIEDTYAPTIARGGGAPRPGTYKLTTPARTDAGVVREVVIAGSVASGRKLAAGADQPVMAPLGIIEIGGARPGDPAYDRVAARFARTGMLVRAASGDGTWAGAPTPALTGGSPCAILFSQGSLWVGAAGTVTYVDDDSVMIFGHPFNQLGDIEALLTGGYVEGAWPSNFAPYKLIAPRDVKGTCVQDRAWGVQGRLGAQAELFPVHTAVAYAGRSAEDDSAAAQWLFTSQAYPSLPADMAVAFTSRFVDQQGLSGSVTTRTTVVVSDATGTYTVDREDVWSDSYDLTWYVGMDAMTALETLAADPNGILDPRVESVTVEADIDRTQRSAYIAAVAVPGGLKTGDNEVVVSYYAYGSAALRTLSATLTIPEGMPLTGRLTVTPGGWFSNEEDGMSYSGQEATGRGIAAPATLAELVETLNAAPANRDLIIAYTAGGGEEGPQPSGESSVTVPTAYVFSEPYSAATTVVKLRARSRTVGYGAPARVSGLVFDSVDVPVSIYRLDAGKDVPVLVTTVTASADEGLARFSAVIPNLRRSATIIAVTAGREEVLAGRATVRVAVRADVRLSGGQPLHIQVRPATSGKALIQARRGGRWIDLRTVRVVDGAGTTRLPKGTWTVRARFSGSDICAPGTSRPFTVVVR